ncbi:MAG: hypothetical protein R2844_07780 [Caldilineales bacterium]
MTRFVLLFALAGLLLVACAAPAGPAAAPAAPDQPAAQEVTVYRSPT